MAMTARPLVVDGLWRCLCPSFQPTKVPRRASCLNGSRSLPFTSRTHRTQSTAASRAERNPFPHTSTSASGTSTSGQPRKTPSSVASFFDRDPVAPTSIPSNGSTPTRLPGRTQSSESSHYDYTARHLPLEKRKQKNLDLATLETHELYERLNDRSTQKRHEQVFSIVKILLKDRRQPPNLTMYSALLRSFTSPQDGTAGKVRKILEDMRVDGIELDNQACHNVLEALAVHPDHLLRNEILEYMRSRWYNLSDTGHNMVVAGLLRERSFEQALDKIDDMIRQRIKVQSWLFDKAIYFLLDYGEVEEAYQLLLTRLENCEQTVSYTLYSQLLDTAARLQHTEAAKYVWDTQVSPGYIKAPTSTCLLVLSIASRTGNVNLATDVFRILTERQTVFDTHHYELLLQSYLHPTSSNLSAALNIILIMNESGLRPTESALHPLYTYLTVRKDRPLEAFTLLQTLESSDKEVPTSAINICLSASIHHNNFPEAVEIYKALHTVSKAGPTTTTFNILFKGCYAGTREIQPNEDDDADADADRDSMHTRKQVVKKDLAMFLAGEMVQLGLKPDALTYDRLVHVCALAGESDDAFSYYEEMRSLSYTGRSGMYENLIRCGLEAGDPRTVGVLHDWRLAKFVPKKELARAVAGRFAEVAVGQELDSAFGGDVAGSGDREGKGQAMGEMREMREGDVEVVSQKSQQS